ncbi:class I SAM-dependent methyltransferase [Benzoatithermus flavus]|uniref:Class I SAM-dependent methyltransferase n=1 Tax=Benzoatithermus flavus TaxID=3108223 RepID=A0ABU8XLC9_9PROT
MTTLLPPREGYDSWAATYDTQENATRDLDAAVLRLTDLPLDGASVIELGAGTGKNTAWLATRTASVLALDLSPGMLTRARERVPAAHVRFLLHDITRPWPVGDCSADLVVGNLVLEHVADLRPVMTEAARALRPGGLLFLGELHPYRQLLGARARFQAGDALALIEAHRHGVSDYVNTALAAGFDLVRLGEWQESPTGPVPATDRPRLLTALFRRR